MRNYNAEVEDNYDKFINLEVQLGDLGSHSTLKCYVDMVSYGCTLFPPHGHYVSKGFLVYGTCEGHITSLL